MLRYLTKLVVAVALFSLCATVFFFQIEDLSPRFEVQQTQNIFTLLLLDTQTGGLWQVQYSLDSKHPEGGVPISTGVLTDGSGYNGRFSLKATPNFWTYMLTDTKTGAMWHCQFSLKAKGFRGCYPLFSFKAH
jgi:hypothetical protein